MDFFIKLQTINNKFKDDGEADENEIVWRRGQPCLARYHLDKKFYRGKVVDNSNQEILKVEFIDYGNVEDCVKSDLRRNVILGNIPCQANKFYLAKIKSPTPIWLTSTLDFIHGHIVGKICSIRIDVDEPILNNEIVPCSIKFENFVLAQLLMERQMVKCRQVQQPKNLFIAKVEEEEEKEIVITNGFLNRNNKAQKSDRRNMPQICERFRRASIFYGEFNDKYNDISCNRDETIIPGNESALIKPLDAKNIEEFVRATQEPEVNVSAPSEKIFLNSDAFETSTQIIDPYDCTPFKSLMIQDDTFGFFCELALIVSPVDLFVIPSSESHNAKCRDLIETIQTAALTAKPLDDISIGATCLAFDQTQNRWFRGIIQSYDFISHATTVFVVDTLKKCKFKTHDLRLCPRECRKYPLQNMRIRLHGVKCNSRVRKGDILLKLEEHLQNAKLYLKLVQNGEIPIVKLYLDVKCTKLAYRELLNEKYFVEI